MRTTTLSPRSAHRPQAQGLVRGLVAVLVALAVALTLAAQPPGADAKGPPKLPPGAANAAAPAKTTTVMTRNLYLGSGLTDIVDALTPPTTPEAIIAAATRTWGNVQASQPEARMAAIADEIVAARPDVVGLQEVTLWSTYAFDPQTGQTVGDPTAAYDFLELLLDALAEKGVKYREVRGATADNFSSDPIPVLTSAPFPTTAVQLEDRDVILARAGVKTTNAQNGNFKKILEPPLSPIAIDRGWGSVDVRTRLARYRFVNSHLEAFEDPLLEGIRLAQVAELFAAQDAIAARYGALPEVYVGDYNTEAPDAQAYLALRERLDDAWVEVGRGEGLTCCTSLTAPSLNLETRIDLILHSPYSVKAKEVEIVGDEPVALPGGVRWASDHMGVVAELVIGRAGT